jgi:hypothetical protein
MSARLRHALLSLVSAAVLVVTLAAQTSRGGGPELVSAGGKFALRYPVAHQHAASACLGYLHFSQDTVRYEVLWPEQSKGHAFEFPKSSLHTARQWTFMGSSLPEAEFKFSGGGTYHFFHVAKRLLDAPTNRFGWDQVLPFQDLINAVNNFEDVLAELKAREERLKPPPAAPPTLSLLDPSGAEEGKTVEAAGSLLRVRGVASHSSGIASVSVNGQAAFLKQLAPQTVEFDARDLPLAAGTSAVVILATATDKAAGQMIFKVARPEVRVLDPTAGYETPEATVSVRGVATGFREVERVDVAGVRANLRRREDGSTEFKAEKVPLSTVGMNTLEGFAVSTSGAREAFKVEVRRKPPPGPPPLSLEDILSLLRGDVAPARVSALVAESGVDFTLAGAVEKQLRTAGADDALLLAIAKAKK